MVWVNGSENLRNILKISDEPDFADLPRRSHIGIKVRRIHHWSFYKNSFFLKIPICQSVTYPGGGGLGHMLVWKWSVISDRVGHTLVLKWSVTNTEHLETNVWLTRIHVGHRLDFSPRSYVGFFTWVTLCDLLYRHLWTANVCMDHTLFLRSILVPWCCEGGSHRFLSQDGSTFPWCCKGGVCHTGFFLRAAQLFLMLWPPPPFTPSWKLRCVQTDRQTDTDYSCD